MRRLAQFLNVREEESRLVGVAFAYSMALGFARIFLVPSQALFLERFEASQLAWGYLASAGGSVVVGAAYIRISRSMATVPLAVLNLVLTGSMTLLLWALLVLGDAGWVRLALFAWNLIFYAFASLAFWNVIRRVFDVRQGKRLFSLISTGDVLAYVVGGLALGPLASLLGTRHIPVFSTVASAVALALLLALVRMQPDRLRGNVSSLGHEPGEADRSTSELLRDPFVLLITAYFILSGLSYIFVDNAFNAGAQAAIGSDNAEELARFFGIFTAATAAANLLFRVFGAGRVVQRLGILGGLAALPLFVLVGASLTVFSGWFHVGGAAAVCAFISATRVSDKVLRGVQNSSLATLYQALPRDGTRVHALMEGIIDPIAFGAAALVLLLARLATPMGAPEMAALTLAVCVTWLGVAVLLARRYRVVLTSLLSRRRVEIVDRVRLDPIAREGCLRTIATGAADEALYCFGLMQSSGDEAVPACVLTLLGRPEPAVVRIAIKMAGTLKLRQALPHLQRLAAHPGTRPDPALIEALCTLDDDGAPGRQYLESPDVEVRTGAMVGLLRSGSLQGILRAGGSLLPLLESASPSDRIRAAEILGRAGVENLGKPLIDLLDDRHAAVRRAALRALRGMPVKSGWDRIVRCMDEPGLAAGAVAVLAAGGPPSARALRERLADPHLELSTRARILRLLGRVDDDGIARLLLDALDDPRPELRAAALEALMQRGFTADGAAAPRVRGWIDRELGLAAIWLHLVDTTGGAPARTREAAGEELVALRARLLRLLALICDAEALRSAEARLASTDPAEQAFAIELLDNVLSRNDKVRLLPLFEGLAPGETLARMGAGRTPLGAAELENALRAHGCRFTRLLAEPAATTQPIVAQVEFLKSVPLFSAVPSTRLLDVAPLLTAHAAQAGESIVHEGDPGDAMYILQAGAAEVRKGTGVVLGLKAGDVFGEYALLTAEPRTASIVATRDSHLLRLGQREFDAILAIEPTTGRSVVQRIARQFIDNERQGRA